MEFYLAAGGEVEMFLRFRLGDCQSPFHARIGTCNGDGLDFFTFGDCLAMSFENLVSSHGYALKILRLVILCREADCSGFEFKYI